MIATIGFKKMPIYEFQCSSCGQLTEIIMKISDSAPSHCQCGAQNSLQKIVSRTNFVLKGSGWYETDFKNNSSKSKVSSECKKDPSDTSPSCSACEAPASPAVKEEKASASG